ncbi:MAG TPA: CHAD domain-containing protein [Verrucomicrobiae bacterium]|nr:CHAD domain-containing protein [Verrucomicrobiae bacterium]
MSIRFDPNSSTTEYCYCRFGAEALAKLLPTMEAQIEGVEKNEDIEYVHKMRVTSRRIRAAMPLFRECFPKKRYKKWLNEIKKVTKFLGAARDLDVQISVINDYIKQLQPTEPKTGIGALLECHTDQRRNMQSNIINGLQELKESRVLQQMSYYCEQIIRETASASFDLFAVREKVFWKISPKLDEFLAMENCVHKENEILKHHEMRIRAKWLRYTMETFAPLYQEEFVEDIEMMKNFQDMLGEMHDCDVWIERVPKFINEIEKETATFQENEKTTAEGNQDLLKFIDKIKEKRKKYHENFVSFWDKEKSNNVFEELRKKASAGFVAAGYRTKAELANPYVKIAIIADVHANLNALEAVLHDAVGRGITVFLNAGDTIGFGAFPNEVIQTLYSKNALSIIGNYDLEVLDKGNRGKGPKKFALEYARNTLTKAYETYLQSLPSKLELEIAHKKFLMIHGISGSVDENLRHDSPEQRFQEVAKTSGMDIIVFDHSYEQFTKKADGALFINPGSVGRPMDGNPQAAYAAITVSPFSAKLIRVSYDVEAAADALRRIGAPESYAQTLLRGLPLENIIAEDKAQENDMERKCTLITRSTRRVARKHWPETKHSEQARKLSLQLFDALQDQHKLGKRERCWLECAAILHDIGLSRGAKGHHQKSLNLILNETQLPFTSIERQVIGNIARYHRKSCPQYKHYNFKSLNRELRLKVTTLAAILRLADDLDFSHQSIIQKLEVQVDFEKVTVQGSVLLNPILEAYAVNKNRDVFEKSFKKKLVVAWKHLQPLQPQPCQQPPTKAQQSILQ